MANPKGIRYTTCEEVLTFPWQIQGTVYESLSQAKMAAAKLWSASNALGVKVRRIKSGWMLLFWRGGVIKR